MMLTNLREEKNRGETEVTSWWRQNLMRVRKKMEREKQRVKMVEKEERKQRELHIDGETEGNRLRMERGFGGRIQRATD